MKELIEKIQESSYSIVFTGAGISTLSGIRDFRGKDGLYKEFDANKIFSLDYFHKDPSYYYTMTREFIYSLHEVKPSLVHSVLGKLEQQGFIQGVITQNVDLLHQKGGSKKVYEIHGSPSFHSCLRCSKIYTYEDVCGMLTDYDVPSCTECGGVIKPDITFFGESLPLEVLRTAQEEASKADLMIVLGSSLVVEPAASLPLYTLHNGGKIVIVNDQETYLHEKATLVYEDLEDTFHYLDKYFFV